MTSRGRRVTRWLSVETAAQLAGVQAERIVAAIEAREIRAVRSVRAHPRNPAVWMIRLRDLHGWSLEALGRPVGTTQPD